MVIQFLKQSSVFVSVLVNLYAANGYLCVPVTTRNQFCSLIQFNLFIE